VKILFSTLITLLILTNSADTGYGYIPKYTEILAEVSAYTGAAEENGGYEGITCEGKPLEEGMVAMDDYPLGTVVIIDDKTYVVADIFGGKYRNRVDIYMDDVSRAWEFGRRRMVIKIMEETN
jgi:3D (Asp-Asp-Asp) domain-containing protein